MTRSMFAALLALFVFALMTGAAAQRVIQYTHFQPASEDQPKHAAALAFKEHVEEASGGDLVVQLYPASQLGDAETVLQGLQLGTIELGVVHDGPIAGFFAPVELISIPYLLEDHETAYRLFDGPFGNEFAAAMTDETGIRTMAIADNGIRHFTNNVRPIGTPEDMQGLTIRIQPSPVYERLVESLGASAVTVSWPELPTALQQGVVDGQENSVTNILAASLYQYQRYVTLDAHVYSVHLYLMNDDFYQGLTPEQQQVVDEGIQIALQIHRDMTRAQDLAAEEILSELGMEVTVLEPEEIEAFRDAAQGPVVEYLEGRVGQDWIETIFAALEAAQAEAAAQ